MTKIKWLKMANNEVREEIEEIGRKTDVNKEKVVK